MFDAVRADRSRGADRGRVLREIRERLRFLHDVGVGYLTLNRSAATLSGGEGSASGWPRRSARSLTGVLYVLDEPSIGLHQRDNRKLLRRCRACAISATPWSSSSTTRRRSAPPTTWSTSGRARASTAAGDLPGEPAAAARSTATDSLTGAYLRGERSIPTPAARRPARRRDRASAAPAPTTSRTSTSRFRSAR